MKQEIKRFTKKEQDVLNNENTNTTIKDAIDEGKINAAWNFFLNK